MIKVIREYLTDTVYNTVALYCWIFNLIGIS